ncbi:uncharacterized protein LOC105680431 [Bombus impatiens]|uniref:Uncharacterized protein LOC105680431 n=1 Tax=Bombus impatiens TaxID=132113 RepID=A0A6P8KXC7_BOMIM|nr:uncharacterized protein LOC105680431 [Bombus impatiens]
MILMAGVLCSLLSKSRLRQRAIRSRVNTGAPYRTRERTTPLYTQRTPTPAPIFGSKPHKALAAAITLETKSLKCGPNVHCLLIVIQNSCAYPCRYAERHTSSYEVADNLNMSLILNHSLRGILLHIKVIFHEEEEQSACLQRIYIFRRS